MSWHSKTKIKYFVCALHRRREKSNKKCPFLFLLFPHSRANVVHQNMCLVTKKRDAKLPNLYVCQNVLRASSSSPTSSNYWNRSSTEVENCMCKYYYYKRFWHFCKTRFSSANSTIWNMEKLHYVLHYSTIFSSKTSIQGVELYATNCTNTN